MEFILIGLVTAVNLIIIKIKLGKKRYEDASLDFLIFVSVIFIFSGTYSGLVVGMVASMVVSIYLYANPPTFFRNLTKTSEARRTWEALKNLDVDGPSSPKYDRYDKL
jgi:hypothetical protein